MIKKLIVVLIFFLGLYTLRETWFYMQVRQNLPFGTTVADIDVSSLGLQEAAETVFLRYMEPVTLQHGGESIPILPSEVGFEIDVDAMFEEASAELMSRDWWQGFVSYIIKRPLEPINIELIATHNEEQLLAILQIAGNFLDNPAKPATIEPETYQFLPGQAGIRADIDATLTEARAALYNPDKSTRIIPFTMVEEPEPDFDILLLKKVLDEQVASYDGVGSYYIKNLQTGEEIALNGDMAISATSIMKIAVLIEAYRAIEGEPTFNEATEIFQTATESSNYYTNLVLFIVAGEKNSYRGADILTESLRNLGLTNSFMETPYTAPARPERSTPVTEANSQQNVLPGLDPAMQTTANDMGVLLSMLYDCTHGGGTLRAVYPEELTIAECQAVVDVMAQDFAAQIIRKGVPIDTIVSHKHGWTYNTHGDAGIVYTPHGDYVIVMMLAAPALTDPVNDWLYYGLTFPIMREMSRITYNFFNAEDPYTDEVSFEVKGPTEEPVEAVDVQDETIGASDDPIE